MNDVRAGDIMALYDHWLHTAEVKNLAEPRREALWAVVMTIHGALTGDGKNEADRSWREAFSHQGAALIDRAVAEAAERRPEQQESRRRET